MSLSNNAKDVLQALMFLIGVLGVIGIIWLSLAWVMSPTTWNFNVNFITDNNTLELFKIMNITRGVTP